MSIVDEHSKLTSYNLKYFLMVYADHNSSFPIHANMCIFMMHYKSLTALIISDEMDGVNLSYI